MTVQELVERLAQPDVRQDMQVRIVMDGFANGVSFVDVESGRVYLYENPEPATATEEQR